MWVGKQMGGEKQRRQPLAALLRSFVPKKGRGVEQ